MSEVVYDNYIRVNKAKDLERIMWFIKENNLDCDVFNRPLEMFYNEEVKNRLNLLFECNEDIPEDRYEDIVEHVSGELEEKFFDDEHSLNCDRLDELTEECVLEYLEEK